MDSKARKRRRHCVEKESRSQNSLFFEVKSTCDGSEDFEGYTDNSEEKEAACRLQIQRKEEAEDEYVDEETTTVADCKKNSRTVVQGDRKRYFTRTKTMGGTTDLNSKVDALCIRLLKDDKALAVLRMAEILPKGLPKKHLLLVMDALDCNMSVQAIYAQGLLHFDDDVLNAMGAVLQCSRVWAVNLGEIFDVSKQAWWRFCENLKSTMVTHMYIELGKKDHDLKTEMRRVLRQNRAKHSLHCSLANRYVIEQVTAMWWNPTSSLRYKRAKEMKSLGTKKRKHRSINGSSS